MNACATLDKIRTDIERIVGPGSIPFSGSYEFASDNSILLDVSKESSSKGINLKVDGPFGPQEANLDNFDKVINVATLFLSKQLSFLIDELELSPCEMKNHGGADEILALFQAFREFKRQKELPFSFYWIDNGNRYELFSVSVLDNRFKVSIETMHVQKKTVKHVTEIENYEEITDKANQFILFELIAWLTPRRANTRRKTALFSKLGSGLVPILLVAITVTGIGTAVWMNMNSETNWHRVADTAENELIGGKSEIGIKHFYRAIQLAQEQNASEEDRLKIQVRMVNLAQEYAPHDLYFKEAAKLIVVAQLYGDLNRVERTMLSVSVEEFAAENYESAAVHLQSLIPLLEKRRGKTFYGLVRCYEHLGRCFVKSGNDHQAKLSFLKAIDIASKTKEGELGALVGYCYFGLGQIEEREKNLESSEKYLKLATKIERKILGKKSYSIVEKRFMETHPRDALKRVQAKLKENQK